LVLQAMPSDIADVDEAILVCDGDVGAVGAELFGHGFTFLGVVVDDDGVGDCEVETEVFDVTWVYISKL